MTAVQQPAFASLAAPAGWQVVEFISDLHLQPEQASTAAAWAQYMTGTQADAVFILGDLFEAWVGDDAADTPGFEADCARILQAACARLDVFFMPGNRDFLLGAALCQRVGMTALEDPTVLEFAHLRWLLSHGDALCLDDAAYQRFRAQVRTPQWQHDFLAQSLAQRRAVAAQLRAASQAHQHQTEGYGDVDADAARAWLIHANAAVLIHGHTHRPGEHALGAGLQRVVLSDWDAQATPPRLQVLRLTHQGLQRQPLPG